MDVVVDAQGRNNWLAYGQLFVLFPECACYNRPSFSGSNGSSFSVDVPWWQVDRIVVHISSVRICSS